MKIEILILLILFFIQFIYTLKINKNLKRELLYAETVLKTTEILKDYTEIYNYKKDKYSNLIP